MTDVVAAPVERCPECGSTLLAHDATRGELTCVLCGLVVQDNQIDLGPEWHIFDPHAQKNHDDPTRTDLITPLKLPFTSTEIGNPRSRQRKRFARLAQIDRGVKLSEKGFANHLPSQGRPTPSHLANITPIAKNQRRIDSR